MKIEELIIDGFKSYAVRTIIDKWDPSFNAITVSTTLPTESFFTLTHRVHRVSMGPENRISSMPSALSSESPT